MIRIIRVVGGLRLRLSLLDAHSTLPVTPRVLPERLLKLEHIYASPADSNRKAR
jgi:hypothetical protein